MRKSFRKKLYGFPVIAGMALAMIGMNMGVVSAEESEAEPEEYAGGIIPVEKELYVVPQSGRSALLLRAGESYAKRYRADEQPWGKDIKIKDQKSSALCWAFSTTTACEYSYAKEMYETTGEVVPVTELSPGHLAQFFYWRVVDPLGNTEGDMNYLDKSYHWAVVGGNSIYGAQHLAGWGGLASEETAPIDKVLEHIVSDEWDGTINPFSADLAYKNELVLQESVVYMNSDPDILKGLVMQYGAVSIAIRHSNDYMNPDEIDPETGEPYDAGRSYYNFESGSGLNHAVTLIGWDDEYPKENFKHEVQVTDEETKTVMPEKDGAFIVQNSWGEEVNEHGIFYISYESREVKQGSNNYILAFDVQPADTYQYNFFYDGTGGIADASDRDDDSAFLDYYTMPGTHAANVFTNTTGHPIEIKAVGYTTYNLGMTYYDVSVYTGLTDPADPESGTCAGTTRISSTTAGCKTAELDYTAIVAPGETYSVVFRFPDYTAFGTEVNRFGTYNFKAHIEEEQSFFRPASSGVWTDMAEYEACFRIKAFANDYEDSTAPVIDGDSLRVDPGAGGAVYAGSEVGVAVQVKDEVAVDSVSALFEAEEADEIFIAELCESEETPGQWEGVFEITDGTSTGPWHVKRITAKDTAGNEAVLYNSKVCEETPNADLSAGDFTVLQEVLTGWQSGEEGKWFYYAEDGTMVTGWLKYASKWYYLDENTGEMRTGWVKYKNKWYYLNATGAMATGWKKDGTDWYYLKANGSMASGEWIRGYWLNRNGTWTYEPRASWKKDEKGWWYGDTAGWYAKKRWMRIDGKWYYFDASGYIVTGKQVIDGETYTFNEEGIFIG